MYADSITDSMRRAIDGPIAAATYKKPTTSSMASHPIVFTKAVDEGLRAIIPQKDGDKKDKINLKKIPKDEYPHLVRELTAQMETAANLEFEKPLSSEIS